MTTTLIVALSLLAAGCESAAGSAAATPRSAPAGIEPPADEEIWAIRCITLQTPDRFARANAFADALKKVKGLKSNLVQVFSDDDGTAVFYGRYRRDYGPTGEAEAYKPDPRQDLDTIRALRTTGADGQDVWPFILATMDLLPTYRPTHPEWDLNRADGYWSLHVAVFFNTREFRTRRSTAEQYCAELRARGEPAYYHHGPVNSSVYVGVYPREAVTDIRTENPLSGQVKTTTRIVDPQMLEAQKRFPHSLQNGHVIYDIQRDKAGNVTQRVAIPSFPVVLPKAQAAAERPTAPTARPPGW